MNGSDSPGALLIPQFAPESLAIARRRLGAPAVQSAPAGVTNSVDVGWTSLLLVGLAAVKVDETSCEPEIETGATPDQMLVMSLTGSYELEWFREGRWRHAVREPGSFALRPGGSTDRVRRRTLDCSPIRTAHLYVPQGIFDEAREEFRRAGGRWRDAPLDVPAVRDPTVAHLVLGLLGAVDAGAPDLYAQAAGQFLATHLLTRYSPWPLGWSDRRHPGLLTDRRLARVLEYMTAHRREPLALEQLAAEAGISKFHFARLFKAATGETPHAYLVGLRMDAAHQMLRDTDLTVAEVAAASGYASVAQFRAAFVRDAGCTPSAFRVQARAGSRSGPAAARPHRRR